MREKCEWVKNEQDHLRRALVLEPRGHADMHAALLTEPASPASHAGLIFMDNDGYGPMCGHAVIAVATIALERGLLMPGGDGRTIVFDTPAGPVRAVATWKGRRVERVAFENAPSFVLHGGLSVTLGVRQLRADVAFGGAFYAIVDGEAVGVPLDAAHVPELRRIGMDIRHAIEFGRTVAHPLEPGLNGLAGTVFTGPPHSHEADLRNVTVFAEAQVDQSPCGNATAAVMAVVDAMGLLGHDKPFVHESLIGTLFEGRVSGRTAVGDYEAIVPEISGAAWITGDHTFFIDDEDPLKDGFRL